MEELKNLPTAISLATLESILKDDVIFRKFIMNFSIAKDIFKQGTKQQYVEALNKLMHYYLKNKEALPKKYVEKMNYINAYYEKEFQLNEIHYAYEEKVEEKDTVSIFMLLSILSEEDIFQKFLNLEENKEYFKNIDSSFYIEAFLELEKFLKEANILLPKHKLERLQDIKSHFVFDTPHHEILNGRICMGEVDSRLEKEIKKRINLEENDFVIARSIYIELCKMVINDDNFFTVKAKGVQEKKDFASIYANLLKKMGIDAVLSYGEEKYALFSYKGVVIKADATKKGNHGREAYHVSDTTRVKIGLKTVGFEALNPEIDIHAAIANADKKHEEYGEIVKRKRRELEEKYRLRKKIVSKDLEDIKETMHFISQLVYNSTLESLDYTDYIHLMLDASIPKGKNIPYAICYKREQERYRSVVLVDLSLFFDNKDTYYLFEEKKEGKILSGLDIRNMKKRGILSIPSEKFEKNLEEKKGWNY